MLPEKKASWVQRCILLQYSPKKKKKTVISAEKFKIIGKRSFFFLAAVARLGIRLWVLETSLIVTDGIKVKLTYIQFRTFYGF